ncbi:hypothetical protein [Klebsiella variicola]|uniref:hypothetical protein n=1 Tax=Klebsiella variicola TaxID=244366 RepID=UPI001D18E46C|nr:hypothetical protein [Klebsiella variicola]MDW0345504.1 hypothetical protein [Klebsiella variicola]MEB6443340.1 hypothetical protein [Klebsiella variicola]WHE62172.1 hypothetical protein QLG20_23475 [Klebsiella variicola]
MMKSLFFAFFIIAVSMFSGVIIAEVSYFFLLFVKYLAYGYIEAECSEILKGLKIGGVGGGVLGCGIILSKLIKVKGF